MSKKRERFPFVARDPASGAASLAPMLPFQLRLGSRLENVSGLIDTGAAVSVLPWSVGQKLGGDWNLASPVVLTGNLASVEARVLVCEGLVGGFTSRRLAFAWSRLENVPILLGQINFLLEFDVCLSRSSEWFELAEPGASS